MKAIWKDAVVAESDDIVEIEGNQYFPAAALSQEFFEKSQHRTSCFWKGEAHYYDIVVKGERNPTAAWTYPQPSEKAAALKDRVAFWKGVRVE